ncbi:MAG: hypothetical protein M3Z66_22550 [Chloroflexota bacterium]|nr:hypothetical protein [Chloroflexota bacterium]
MANIPEGSFQQRYGEWLEYKRRVQRVQERLAGTPEEQEFSEVLAFLKRRLLLLDNRLRATQEELADIRKAQDAVPGERPSTNG